MTDCENVTDPPPVGQLCDDDDDDDRVPELSGACVLGPSSPANLRREEPTAASTTASVLQLLQLLQPPPSPPISHSAVCRSWPVSVPVPVPGRCFGLFHYDVRPSSHHGRPSQASGTRHGPGPNQQHRQQEHHHHGDLPPRATKPKGPFTACKFPASTSGACLAQQRRRRRRRRRDNNNNNK